jgi:hypothetical protein
VTERRVSTVGLSLPDDFDVESYQAVHSRMKGMAASAPVSWSEYAGAWNAVAYRFLTCAEHDKTFTESILRHGDAPPQLERYVQERELFGFFVTGLATIESLCYAAYAIASMLDEGVFPIATEENKRLISPRTTAPRFAEAFPTYEITRALRQVVGSHELHDWREVRNTLTHRTAPGRVIHASTSGPAKPAVWKIGIRLDACTTASRRRWLASTVNMLLKGLADFTTDRF